MKFERSSWRKLYVIESAEHGLMPLFTRGLRDYLLRFAADDGTILRSSSSPKKDLHRLLRAERHEQKSIDDSFDDLVRIGYLSVDGGRVWITKFEEAQSARSAGAKRQAEYKERKETQRRQQSASPQASPESVSTGVTADASVTSQIEETRRDETRTTKPPAVVTLAERAARVLENPHDGQYQRPSQWPEILAVGVAWSFGMPVKFRDFADADSDLRAILEAFRDGYTVEQCVLAGEKAKTSEHFAKQRRPGPASFSAGVLRRLLAGDPQLAKASGDEDNGGYGTAEGYAV